MKVLHDVPLSGYTSLKAGGPAQTLIELEVGDELSGIISQRKGGNFWVLGYGTNCLISDKGLPGTVIINKFGQIEQLSSTKFKVDSGVNWDTFVQQMIANDLWGLEFTSGIPGGTGAAVVGNIAAYGHKIADSLVEATMFDTRKGEMIVWQNQQFGFDYRTSILHQPENKHLVILDATFELASQPNSELQYESALKVARELDVLPDTLKNRRQIIIETRRRASSLLQDITEGPWTAGSFFKNPVVDDGQVKTIMRHEERAVSQDQLIKQNLIHGQHKGRVSAALVLLAAGFERGQTWGSVRLNPEHVLKVENTGNATGKEIYDVVNHIIVTVNEKLGIKLEPEVRFLGEF